MFLTESRFEHRIPYQLVAAGTQSWRVVELSLHTPWYLVTLHDAREGCLRDLILGDDSDVVQLIEADGNAIKALHRITPNRGSHGWQMEPVVEVRRVPSTAEAGRFAWSFLGRNGTSTYWPRTNEHLGAHVGELVIALEEN